MRLLEQKDDGHFGLTKDLTENIPPYAILSHTWGPEEVTFKDLMEGTDKSKSGYYKIRFCAEQAKRDGLQYFWVDTCCIDKSNSFELTEAINSMFQWYRKAAKCYVYLSDISKTDYDDNGDLSWTRFISAFKKSSWFTRGWTLQELIASTSVIFFSSDCKLLGDKISMEQEIYETTGIAVDALRGHPLSEFSEAERMSWAANRHTTREEDEVYSLLGIFEVYMPVIYGEGKEKAFVRLQKEIDVNRDQKGMASAILLVQTLIIGVQA
jgi:hypothetical protein